VRNRVKKKPSYSRKKKEIKAAQSGDETRSSGRECTGFEKGGWEKRKHETGQKNNREQYFETTVGEEKPKGRNHCQVDGIETPTVRVCPKSVDLPQIRSSKRRGKKAHRTVKLGNKKQRDILRETVHKRGGDFAEFSGMVPATGRQGSRRLGKIEKSGVDEERHGEWSLF